MSLAVRDYIENIPLTRPGNQSENLCNYSGHNLFNSAWDLNPLTLTLTLNRSLQAVRIPSYPPQLKAAMLAASR